MKIILLFISLFMYLFGIRIMWKINQWLFIDLFIGRKNFYNFYKSSKITIDNMIKLEEK